MDQKRVRLKSEISDQKAQSYRGLADVIAGPGLGPHGVPQVPDSPPSDPAASAMVVGRVKSPFVDIESENRRLTQRIEAIEKWFCVQSWKTACEIQLGNYEWLSFERFDKGWAFVFVSRVTVEKTPSLLGDWRPQPPEFRMNRTLLRDCSISVKARAAVGLPALIQAMRAAYDTRVQDLASGHAALDQIEQSLHKGTLGLEGV